MLVDCVSFQTLRRHVLAVWHFASTAILRRMASRQVTLTFGQAVAGRAPNLRPEPSAGPS